MSEEPGGELHHPQHDGQPDLEAVTAPLPVTPPSPPSPASAAGTDPGHLMWSRTGPAAPVGTTPLLAHLPGLGQWGQGQWGQGFPSQHMPAQPAQPKPRSAKRGLAVAALLLVLLVGAAGAGAGVVSYLDHRGGAAVAAPGPAGAAGQDRKGVPAAVADHLLTVTEVAAKVQPAVVQIEVVLPDGRITGSGVILTSDGRILTNNHVVAEAGDKSGAGSRDAGGGTAMLVHLHDGTTLSASVVATDPDSDLAVIQVKGRSDLPVAKLGSSADLVVGQDVVAIGSPLGLEGTVTRGIVSALGRPVAAGDDGAGHRASALEAIQTDASINPGNSGGALVNLKGEVVGINFMIFTLGDKGGESGSIGLGFAIPVDLAKRVSDQLVRDGKAAHASLGVTVKGTDPTATVRGASVMSVVSGSGAEAAGLDVGAVITKVSGHPIDGTVALVAAVRDHAPGEKVDVTYTDGSGAQRTVSVTLGSI